MGVIHMAQRLSAATKREIVSTLEAFHDVNEAKKEVDREYRRLRKAVEAVPDGQFGDYLKTYGNPRTQKDLDAIDAHYEEIGEPVPTKLSYPIVVRKVTS